MCQSRWKICQILVKCLKIAQKAKSGHTDSLAHLKTFRERRFQNLVKNYPSSNSVFHVNQ